MTGGRKHCPGPSGSSVLGAPAEQEEPHFAERNTRQSDKRCVQGARSPRKDLIILFQNALVYRAPYIGLTLKV
jgi:hypothetical protein